MEFWEFFQAMCMHYCNHGSLTYANYTFLEQFLGENKELPNKSFQADIPPNRDRLELSPQKVKTLIEIYKDTFKISYSDSARAIWIYNTKSINARAVTSYYELIKKYLNSRGKKEIYEFHDKYDWFKLLNILRNIFAHGDTILEVGIEFPDRGKTLMKHIKPYPDTIVWDNIIINRGQKEIPLINEVQVSKLLNYIMIFFTSNNNFNVGILHSQNRRKIKT